jgi:hypothetical protein
MGKSSRSPQGQFEPEQLPAFFRAIDIDETFQQFALRTELEQIATAFWKEFNRPTTQQNKRLRQYLRSSYKKRNLWQELGPTVHHQIIVASYLRANPNADIVKLSVAVEEEQISLAQVAKEETEHELDVKFLIGLSGNYRKRLLTKLVVEPALRLLRENGVKPSRKLPLNRMAHALFDLFGVAPRDRVTDAAITDAWRRLNRRQAKPATAKLRAARRV